MHFPQQTNALHNAFTVHFIERFIKDHQPHRIAQARRVIDPVQLGKGSQHGDIERRLGLTAGLGIQRLGQQLTVPVAVGGLQVKPEVCPEIRIPFNILLELALLPGVVLRIVGPGNPGEQILNQRSVFLLERQSEQSPLALHQLRRQNHIIIVPVVGIPFHQEPVTVRSELGPLQSPVQIAHLLLDLVDTGFELGQKIVLELLQSAFPCLADFLPVLGQGAVGQQLPFRFKFVVMGRVHGKGTGPVLLDVLPPQPQQLFPLLGGVGLRLRGLVPQLPQNGGGLFQPLQRLPVPGQSHGFPVLRRIAALDGPFRLRQQLPRLGQLFLCQLLEPVGQQSAVAVLFPEGFPQLGDLAVQPGHLPVQVLQPQQIQALQLGVDLL